MVDDREDAHMMVVRQSEPSDLQSLMALAALAGPGLTTLPRSEEVLSEHLADSAY